MCCWCSSGPHYRDKQTVSWRLSLSGLAVAYNQTVSRYLGPYPTLLELSFTSHMITVWYDNGAASIDVRATGGFEVGVSLANCF